MSSYSQPAAANYYTPPNQTPQRQRGHRVCDHCGVEERPSVPRFRLCGGCMTTQYCSQECQRTHWPSHKAICQHTASQISAAKHMAGAGATDENLVKNLRKFCSGHASLIGWAGFQGLQLKRLPANIRQNILLIELNYRGSSSADGMRRFSIKGTHIVPRTYISDPLVWEDIQRRDERCRRSGGIGCCVVLVQCGEVSQVMPIEVDSPSKISWDVREDWEDVLQHFVSSGRTDFAPISTSARGIVYG